MGVRVPGSALSACAPHGANGRQICVLATSRPHRATRLADKYARGTVSSSLHRSYAVYVGFTLPMVSHLN